MYFISTGHHSCMGKTLDHLDAKDREQNESHFTANKHAVPLYTVKKKDLSDKYKQ